MKKTFNCKTCGAEISRKAKKCPHCGEPTPGNTLASVVSGLIFAPIIVIFILIAICFYIGFFGWLF